MTLWVVTEESVSDGMNLQAKTIAQRMEESHESLTIQLDILPNAEQEREIALKQLRTKIMAGDGPDVYLLPIGDTLTMDYAKRGTRITTQNRIEPLFRDVTQAMRSGLFADIQDDYDADQALGKEALNTQIMDAGVVNGRRYVLPLRFDTPTILTDPALWTEFGLDQGLMDAGTPALTEALLARGAQAIPFLQLPSDLSLLPRCFDYEKEDVLLTAQQIAEYLQLYQAWSAVSTGATQTLLQQWDAITLDISLTWYREQNVANVTTGEELRKLTPFTEDISSFNKIPQYLNYDMHWHSTGFPLYTCRLADTLITVAIAKYEEYPLTMLPLKATDGSVIASVTYFGAVGSSSEAPELAYEFLRQFLTEEFQWDIYRPRITKDLTFMYSQNADVQTSGQVENSWPVRTAGSVPYLWSSIQYQQYGAYSYIREEGTMISRLFQAMELTDADVPALSWHFDEVRFPVTLDEEDSLEHALSLLNEEDGTPTEVDIDALAEEVRLNLWWHLAEG